MPADSKRMADRANGILLDTSAVIAHLRGGIDVLALTKPTEPLFLPLVALGELYIAAFPRPFGQVGQFDRPLLYIAELASVGLAEFQAA